LAYIFAADSIGLSSFKFLQWAPKVGRAFSAIECPSAVQGPPRSIMLVLIESAYATSC